MRAFVSFVLVGLCFFFSSPEGVAAQAETAGDCYPPCRKGYLCHPVRLECVPACNPPCEAGLVCDETRFVCMSACNPACQLGQVCTESGECIAEQQSAAVIAPVAASAATPPPEPAAKAGNTGFRLVLLGRFGLSGSFQLKTPSGEKVASETPAQPTLGFDLRFEKPPSRFVSMGAVLSNYWIRPDRASPRDYAFDASVFVKPRYAFKIGKNEGEVYVLVQVGPTLLLLDESYSETLDSLLAYGFNVGATPGVQIGVARSFALIVETGYMFNWYKLHDGGGIDTLSQFTIRTGFAFTF